MANKNIKKNSFWKGFFSIFNIWGTPVEYEHDDYKAIANDWKIIGQDMQRAIDMVAEQYGK